jgi:hypothetical protein
MTGPWQRAAESVTGSPRDAGGLPAFGRQPRIETGATIASRFECMSGL